MDPGFLEVAAGDAEQGQPSQEQAKDPTPNLGLCQTCNVVKPLRAKHCVHCNRCLMFHMPQMRWAAQVPHTFSNSSFSFASHIVFARLQIMWL